MTIGDDRPPATSMRGRTTICILRLVSVGMLVVVAAVAVGAASHPHSVDLSLEAGLGQAETTALQLRPESLVDSNWT